MLIEEDEEEVELQQKSAGAHQAAPHSSERFKSVGDQVESLNRAMRCCRANETENGSRLRGRRREASLARP